MDFDKDFWKECPHCAVLIKFTINELTLEIIAIKKAIRYTYKKLCDTIGEHLAGSIMMRDDWLAGFLKEEDRKKFGLIR